MVVKNDNQFRGPRLHGISVFIPNDAAQRTSADGQPTAQLAAAKDTPQSRPEKPRKRPARRDRDHQWLKPVVRRVKVLRREGQGDDADHERAKNSGLRIVHFGGLGEIGKNNMVAIHYNNEIILIDSGIGFPRENMPGIDFSIPNVGYLDGKTHLVKAMFFSHGHLDHIGALPYIRDRIGKPDIYAAPFTRALLLKRMAEFKDKPPLHINDMLPGDEVRVSENISVRAHRINHSIPDDLLFEIKTPVGTLVHAIDYKFDDNPVNDIPASIDDLKALGDRGVLVLMGDSTGAEQEGHSLSESDVTKDLEKLLRESTGLTIVGCFASTMNRVQQLVTISEKLGKKVVFDGYSMKTNTEIAKQLGYLKLNRGTQITMEEVSKYPRDKIVAVVTGAQGEGNAALMRIANGEHRFIRYTHNDTFIFSSSIIPGNEVDVEFLRDQLYRNGAKVFNYHMLDVHASGHGRKEDLRKMVQYLRPKFVMPVHGQYTQMVHNGLIAQEEGVPPQNIIIADNGTIIHIETNRWWFDKDQAPSDYVFVDGLGIGDVGNVVLRDRQLLAEDGFIVVVTLLDSNTGKVRGSPDIISRGFIYLRENKEILMQVRKKIRFLVESQHTTRPNLDYLKDQIRNQVGQFLFQKMERRPMVLPVLIEV